VSFQPGALSGRHPSELDPTKIGHRLSAGLPLMRLATDRRTTDIKPAFYCTSPKLAVIRQAPRTSLERLVPFGSVVLGAFGAVGIAAAAASLQGFSPFVGWGTLSPDFSACSVPGSPGIHPPWGIPLPDPWPLSCRAQPRYLDGNSECCLSQKNSNRSTRSASLGIAGRHPHQEGHRTLCFKCQRAGKLACLSRGCRPLEVLALIFCMAGH
jgi:hypothetical protein